MTLNIVDIQDEIFDFLESAVSPYPLEEQGVPDADTVRKEGGKILPYIALQFGDLQRRANGETFAGVRTFDYELPIYVQVCAANPRDVRRIANGVVLDKLLGFSSQWTGEVRKRPGGAMWPITNSTGATEAYVFPTSYALTVQMNDAM